MCYNEIISPKIIKILNDFFVCLFFALFIFYNSGFTQTHQSGITVSHSTFKFNCLK